MYLIDIELDYRRTSLGARPKELSLPRLDVGGEDVKELGDGIVEVFLESQPGPSNAVIEILWKVVLECRFEHLEG